MSSSHSEIKRLGGSPSVALSNNFKIDTNAMLEEAWRLTKTTKAPIVTGALIMFVIALVCSQLIAGLFPPTELPDGSIAPTPMYLFLFMVLQIGIMPIFMAGLFMMGVKNSVSLSDAFARYKPIVPANSPSMVFALFRQPWPVIATEAIRQAILTASLAIAFAGFGLIGFAMWIFFAVTLNLAIPLVIKDNLSPFKAIKVSVQVSARKFFQFFILYFVMLVLFFLGLLTLGVGLIWVVPMYFNLIGIVYRDVFGIETPVENDLDTVEL